LSTDEKKLLASSEYPIVIVKKNSLSQNFLTSVAPGLSEVGLMIPYTPVHHLLFDNAPYDLLVMTSANTHGNPMYIDEHEVIHNLRNSVDAILTHNRSIVVRLDDSVTRIINKHRVLLRRARGYVPASLKSPFNINGYIGLGGQMKTSIAIGRDNSCFVSEYLGTIDTLSTIEASLKRIDQLLAMFDVEPGIIAMDKHPSGLYDHLVKYNIPAVTVQHHHAHAAACMGENNVVGKTICVIYDGTGLGDDGSIWGGEIFIADYNSYTRVAHLKEMSMAGNIASIEFPYRMAISACAELFVDNVENVIPYISLEELDSVVSLIGNRTFSIPTTSMGRLFDSCSAILDICRKRTYEGQPAIELESATDPLCKDYYSVPILESDQKLIMDGPALLRSVVEDRDSLTPSSIIAARFQNTIAMMTIECVKNISKRYSINQVVLSGGCFCNKLLLERVFEGLDNNGLTIYSHHELPPGDENISYGQVLVAAAAKVE